MSVACIGNIRHIRVDRLEADQTGISHIQQRQRQGHHAPTYSGTSRGGGWDSLIRHGLSLVNQKQETRCLMVHDLESLRHLSFGRLFDDVS